MSNLFEESKIENIKKMKECNDCKKKISLTNWYTHVKTK